MRTRIPLLAEIPLLVWLVILWGALWQDYSLGNLVFGLAIGLVIVNIFYLPPVELGGRLNLLASAVFVLTFIGSVAAASFQVLWVSITKGPRTKNAVLAVKLRTRSDLIVTATGHTISLIPGSLVVDVDRSTSTLYLHCLDISSPESAERFRDQVRRIEAGLIRSIGSKEELAIIRAEKQNASTGGSR
ncbi:monovalent cation/H+ antiporter subunit E [Arthrobacter crystallopoietes BAB-32]|uniref:Monovalent cation/H+ antiporter subunit E n=1 Tax=Arthrobacter crystallopoietes BAB-32 TaxID=1246476 RepID=N1UXM6_9MICC|nr:monovalent cation/H+ antiporter subunit E [Arthrobacter crystallopoietes BAB-32]